MFSFSSTIGTGAEHRLILGRAERQERKALRRGVSLNEQPESASMPDDSGKRKNELETRKDNLLKKMEEHAEKSTSKKTDWNLYKEGFLKQYDLHKAHYERVTNGQAESLKQLEQLLANYEARLLEQETASERETKDGIPEKIAYNTWSLTLPAGEKIGLKFGDTNAQYSVDAAMMNTETGWGDLVKNGFNVSVDAANPNRLIIHSELSFQYDYKPSLVAPATIVPEVSAAPEPIIEKHRTPASAPSTSAENTDTTPLPTPDIRAEEKKTDAPVSSSEEESDMPLPLIHKNIPSAVVTPAPVVAPNTEKSAQEIAELAKKPAAEIPPVAPVMPSDKPVDVTPQQPSPPPAPLIRSNHVSAKPEQVTEKPAPVPVPQTDAASEIEKLAPTSPQVIPDSKTEAPQQTVAPSATSTTVDGAKDIAALAGKKSEEKPPVPAEKSRTPDLKPVINSDPEASPNPPEPVTKKNLTPTSAEPLVQDKPASVSAVIPDAVEEIAALTSVEQSEAMPPATSPKTDTVDTPKEMNAETNISTPAQTDVKDVQPSSIPEPEKAPETEKLSSETVYHMLGHASKNNLYDIIKNTPFFTSIEGAKMSSAQTNYVLSSSKQTFKFRPDVVKCATKVYGLMPIMTWLDYEKPNDKNTQYFRDSLKKSVKSGRTKISDVRKIIAFKKNATEVDSIMESFYKYVMGQETVDPSLLAEKVDSPALKEYKNKMLPLRDAVENSRFLYESTGDHLAHDDLVLRMTEEQTMIKKNESVWKEDPETAQIESERLMDIATVLKPLPSADVVKKDQERILAMEKRMMDGATTVIDENGHEREVFGSPFTKEEQEQRRADRKKAKEQSDKEKPSPTMQRWIFETLTDPDSNRIISAAKDTPFFTKKEGGDALQAANNYNKGEAFTPEIVQLEERLRSFLTIDKWAQTEKVLKWDSTAKKWNFTPDNEPGDLLPAKQLLNLLQSGTISQAKVEEYAKKLYGCNAEQAHQFYVDAAERVNHTYYTKLRRKSASEGTEPAQEPTVWEPIPIEEQQKPPVIRRKKSAPIDRINPEEKSQNAFVALDALVASDGMPTWDAENKVWQFKDAAYEPWKQTAEKVTDVSTLATLTPQDIQTYTDTMFSRYTPEQREALQEDIVDQIKEQKLNINRILSDNSDYGNVLATAYCTNQERAMAETYRKIPADKKVPTKEVVDLAAKIRTIQPFHEWAKRMELVKKDNELQTASPDQLTGTQLEKLEHSRQVLRVAFEKESISDTDIQDYLQKVLKTPISPLEVYVLKQKVWESTKPIQPELAPEEDK
jgi:hypothetical protein